MKQLKVIILFLGIFMFMSCSAQKEQIGNYENLKGKTITYEKGKNIYLFWDQVQLQNIEKDIKIKDYEKTTRRNVFDNVIYYGTFGMVSFYTVTIKTKEEKGNKPQN